MNSPDPYEDYRWTEEAVPGSVSSSGSSGRRAPQPEPLRPTETPLGPDPLEARGKAPEEAPQPAPSSGPSWSAERVRPNPGARRPGSATRPESLKSTGSAKPGRKRTSDWPLMAHLSTFAGLAVPFGNVLGPLVIWLAMREDDAEAEWHAREALNFQISLWIWGFIGVLLALSLIGLPVAIVGFIFGGTFSLIVTLIAAVKAHQGERWEYPLCFRLVGPPDLRSEPNAEHLGATA